MKVLVYLNGFSDGPLCLRSGRCCLNISIFPPFCSFLHVAVRWYSAADEERWECQHPTAITPASKTRHNSGEVCIVTHNKMHFRAIIRQGLTITSRYAEPLKWQISGKAHLLAFICLLCVLHLTAIVGAGLQRHATLSPQALPRWS